MALYSGQTLINGALNKLGILPQGGVPSASDSTVILGLLNDMFGLWHTLNKLIFSIQFTDFLLTANQSVYPIGPAASSPFNVPRPNYIEDAEILLANPSTGSFITFKLEKINSDRFSKITDLGMSADIPQQIYNDRASPASNLYLIPGPRCAVATKLRLHQWAQLGTFANVNASVDLPDGYSEAVQHALAVRCIPMYGVAVNGQVAQTISALALQAEKALQTLNDMGRGVATEPPPVPETATEI